MPFFGFKKTKTNNRKLKKKKIMPCFLATLIKINKTIHKIKAPAFPTFAYVYKSIFGEKGFHA